MKWASALSVETSLDGAIQEAALAVSRQLGSKAPDLALLFVSRRFLDRSEEAGALLTQRLKTRVILGANAAAVVGNGQELESTPAVSLTAAVLPDVKIEAFSVQDQDMPDLDGPPRAWEKWLGVQASAHPLFILLADPFSFRIENFIMGLDYAFPKSAKIGGLASSGHTPGHNALYLNNLCLRSGLVGVALTGNIQMDTLVSQGCRPIGQPLRVTQCEDNILVTLNGTPPVTVLQSLFSELSENDRQLMRQALFVGIARTSGKDSPEPRDFLIRNIIGVDDRRGAMAIGSPLRPGQTLQFHLRDARRCSDNLQTLLDGLGETKGQTQGALLFSCVGLGKSLFGTPNHDTGAFARHVGPVPLGGFFCNGEIGPIEGTTYLHGYTSCFGLFRPKQ